MPDTETVGFWSGYVWPGVTIVAYILAIVVPLLVTVAYLTYAERKVMAAMQIRRGPNVVGPFGLLQPFADGLKLLMKETIIPAGSNRVVFLLAPVITFVLALVFIYLVLAAQFESFSGPFVILLTVPLAVTGALGALYFAGQTLNVYSQIGLLMLVGLITKNGILIVEFSNQMQARGLDRLEAVVQASVRRLRPILMTSATMILAAVPLAFASGAGAESRHPIGWTIVGGLMFGSLLTLFVVPTTYTYLVPRLKRETDPDTLSGQPPVQPAGI